MAFKSLAVLASFVLLAVLPNVDTASAALVPHNGANNNLYSRAKHSELVRRATSSSSSGKKCSKYRTGKKVTTTTSTSSTAKPTSTSTKTTTTTTKKTTSTTKTTAKASATPAVAGSKKAGMIFTGAYDGFLKNAESQSGGQIWRTYNWGASTLAEASAAGIKFIPTFWGEKTEGDWSVVTEGYATEAFGCNEVNQNGQSTMSVSTGCSLWKQYMSPLVSKGYTLYGHSISNAASGFDWYDDFKGQCADGWSEWSALNLHYYSNDPQGMIDYLNAAYDRYGKPIVVSEFGCANWSGVGAVDANCTASDVQQFLKTTIAFMESKSWIIGYFFFGYFPEDDPQGGVPAGDALYTNSGDLNTAGKAYFQL